MFVRAVPMVVASASLLALATPVSADLTADVRTATSASRVTACVLTGGPWFVPKEMSTASFIRLLEANQTLRIRISNRDSVRVLVRHDCPTRTVVSLTWEILHERPSGPPRLISLQSGVNAREKYTLLPHPISAEPGCWIVRTTGPVAGQSTRHCTDTLAFQFGQQPVRTTAYPAPGAAAQEARSVGGLASTTSSVTPPSATPQPGGTSDASYWAVGFKELMASVDGRVTAVASYRQPPSAPLPGIGGERRIQTSVEVTPSDGSLAYKTGGSTRLPDALTGDTGELNVPLPLTCSLTELLHGDRPADRATLRLDLVSGGGEPKASSGTRTLTAADCMHLRPNAFEIRGYTIGQGGSVDAVVRYRVAADGATLRAVAPGLGLQLPVSAEVHLQAGQDSVSLPLSGRCAGGQLLGLTDVRYELRSPQVFLALVSRLKSEDVCTPKS